MFPQFGFGKELRWIKGLQQTLWALRACSVGLPHFCHTFCKCSGEDTPDEVVAKTRPGCLATSATGATHATWNWYAARQGVCESAHQDDPRSPRYCPILHRGAMSADPPRALVRYRDAAAVPALHLPVHTDCCDDSARAEQPPRRAYRDRAGTNTWHRPLSAWYPKCEAPLRFLATSLSSLKSLSGVSYIWSVGRHPPPLTQG